MALVKEIMHSLKAAQVELSQMNGRQKDLALLGAAEAIHTARQEIFNANGVDTARARSGGMKESLVDRLLLNDTRIDSIIEGIKTVVRLDDPIGKVRAGWKTAQGLLIEQVTVPLGVAAIIYESRPNVTVDAFSLAYKAGCSILLRGSSSALESNRALVKAIKKGLQASGASLPQWNWRIRETGTKWRRS